MTPTTVLDADTAYRALSSRDPRFDGRVWYGVTSTGIYCRPVCPARTPRPENVRLFASRAAAVAAGFRACRRCRPDSAPGTRDWDTRHDLAARAVRLIGSGVVDQIGVGGLADRLHVSARHLHRTLVAEVGAGAMPLALSRRAQTARLLLDQTDLPVADVAFAAGFASIRQFNDVFRREFGLTPSGVRAARAAGSPAREQDDGRHGGQVGPLALRLRWRGAYDLPSILQARVALSPARVDPVASTIERSVRLPSGTADCRVSLRPDDGFAALQVAGVALADLADLVQRVRRWLDLDADPDAVTDVLGADPRLASGVAAHPGTRVLASLDPWEAVLTTVVAQRVSAASASAVLAAMSRLLAPPSDVGLLPTTPAGTSPRPAPWPDPDPLPAPLPDAAAVAAAGPDLLRDSGLPSRRATTLHAVAEQVATGRIGLAVDADPGQLRARLLAVPGIGPWTAEVVAMRALGDPDAFPSGDLALRRSAATAGLDPAGLAGRSGAWRPWRSYAATLLWRLDAEAQRAGHGRVPRAGQRAATRPAGGPPSRPSVRRQASDVTESHIGTDEEPTP